MKNDASKDQQKALEQEVEVFLQQESSDHSTTETEEGLTDFLEMESQSHYSSEVVEEELDIFFENENLPPWKALKGDDESVHIGIDSEYVYNEEENRNDILSYQYYLIAGKNEISDVILTPVAEVIKKSRAANKSREDELKAINKVKKPRKKVSD